MITRETDYAAPAAHCGMGSAVQRRRRRSGSWSPVLCTQDSQKLARAGFVEVARGAEGGCRLSAELNRVTLYDLMTAMGEDSRLSSCMDPTYSCPWRASMAAVRFTAI